MGNDITVVKLLRDAPAYDGQVLSVEGQFIATFERAMLAAFPASLAMSPDWPKLELVYPGIEDRCFRVVSP
ncbi:MAG TPA: hypothetical protein VFS00_28835, partial [Polyangiaceae bacterium]|nr:hypothetical protein [Polyangiaceae bacterium]